MFYINRCYLYGAKMLRDGIMKLKTQYSQCGQDRWVVNLFRGKRDGFFVEAGAADGIQLSNTLLLEKHLGWKGILIEPTSAFEKLLKNRPNCILHNSCLGSERKTVILHEICDCGWQAGNLFLSRAIDDNGIFKEKVDSNNSTISYQKEAVPLQEILLKYNAPKVIDYFSLDVEGYEYEVLRNFPFKDYTFLCIGVERPPKELKKILKDNGYIWITQILDHMYVHQSIGNFLLLRIMIISIFDKLRGKINKLLYKIARVFSLLRKKESIVKNFP
jgi:hypothetical protein